MHILLRWIINALLLLLVAYLIPGFHVASFYAALFVALALGILNAIVRPILVILTLPITILTLGLFTFVINAFLLWFVSSFIKGFSVDSFTAAFLGAAILWLGSWLTNAFVRSVKP